MVVAARGQAAAPAPAAAAGTAGQWRTYGGDLASTRYSPLAQITAENFGTLRVAWRFRTDNFGPRPEIALQATPLYADGALYAAVGTRRTAVSLDPASGELLWSRRFDERPRTFPRGLSGRGVAYWQSGATRRVFMVSPGYQLLAIDATTGELDPAFGTKGVVDMRTQLGYTCRTSTRRRSACTRRRSSPAASSSSARRTCPAARRRPRSTSRAWSRASTPARARSCGGSSPFPATASRATRPG